MDKETAAAIEAWLKTAKKDFVGHNTEYARGFKSACKMFSDVIKAAKSGDLDRLKEI